MANLTSILRLQLLDQVSGPSKGAANSMKNLENAISQLGRNGARGAKNLVGQLDHLRDKASKLGQFNALRQGLANTAVEFRRARDNAKQLQQALSSTANPTKKMQADMRAAQNAVRKATEAFREQRSAVRQSEQALKAFGVNSRSGIVQSQQQVRNEIAKTIREMRKLDRESKKTKPKPVQRPSSVVGEAAGAYAGARAGQTALGMVVQGAHQEAAVNRIRNVSNSEAEVEKAREIASEVSRAYPYTSQEAALHDYVETRSIAATGDRENPVNFEQMRKNQMTIAKGRSALASNGEQLSDFDVRNLMLALEGSGRAMDPEGLSNLMDAYVRAKQTLGTAIDANKVRDFVANAKASNFSMSDPAFFTTTMARLAQGNASRLGNEFAQTLSTLVGGRMTKQGAMWLVDKGLITKDQIVNGGGGKFSIKGNIKEQDLLSTDQTAWAQQVLMPALDKTGVTSKDAVKKRMSVLRKADPKADPHTLEERAIHGLIADSLMKSGFRATVADNLAHAIGNEIITKRNVEQMQGAMGLDAASTLGQNPVAAWQEFVNSISNFAGVLTGPAMQSAGQTLHSLADSISYFSGKLESWQKDNPEMAKVAGAGATTAVAAGGSYVTWRVIRSLLGGGGGGTAGEAGKAIGGSRWLGGALGRAGGLASLLFLSGSSPHNAYAKASAEDRQRMRDEARKEAEQYNSANPDQRFGAWLKRFLIGDAADPNFNFKDKMGIAWKPYSKDSKTQSHPDDQIGDPGLTGDAATGSAAANQTMSGFNQSMQARADEARAIMAQLMSDIQAMAAATVSPTIRPKLDMSAISGVHADVGIE